MLDGRGKACTASSLESRFTGSKKWFSSRNVLQTPNTHEMQSKKHSSIDLERVNLFTIKLCLFFELKNTQNERKSRIVDVAQIFDQLFLRVLRGRGGPQSILAHLAPYVVVHARPRSRKCPPENDARIRFPNLLNRSQNFSPRSRHL